MQRLAPRPRRSATSIVASILLTLTCVVGCGRLSLPGAHQGAKPGAERVVQPLNLTFEGPGRLALLWEVPDRDGDVQTLLAVYDAEGTEPVPVSGVSEVRWLDPELLLLSVDAGSNDPADWGLTEIVTLDLERKQLQRVAPPRRHFNLEVSPDRTWLALGVQVNDRGDSDLEIWYLAADLERVAERREPLDEPRWSPGGIELVVSRTVQDPDAEESDTSASFGGMSLAWPRLFRLRRDLATSLVMVHDGPLADASDDAPEQRADLEPGGTYPLWWDERGIFARQRRGLVRCDPDSRGCALVYDPGESLRVVDGRAIADEALLLVLDTNSEERLPSQLHRINLQTGKGQLLARTPPNTYITDLDWIPLP